MYKKPIGVSFEHISFGEGISDADKRKLSEMFVVRLKGHNSYDVVLYLCDFSPAFTAVFDGKVVAINRQKFERIVRFLFFFYRLFARIGLPRMWGEIFEMVIEKRENDHLASFLYVRLHGNKIVYTGRCQQTIQVEDGHMKFKDLRMDKIPRESWPFRYIRNQTGRHEFVYST